MSTLSRRRNFSNSAAPTTLNGAISSSATSLVVALSTNYPDAPFTVRIDTEIILVGVKSGLNWTSLTRGYDGTVAAGHANGATVTHVAVAADFRRQWIDPLTWDDTPTVYDDEFDDDDSSGWSNITPTGTATWSEALGLKSVLFSGQSANDCAASVMSINGLAYPLYVVTATRLLAPHADYSMFGPVFTNGPTTSSSAIWCMPHYDDTNPGRLIYSLRSGTLTNISTTHWSADGLVTVGAHLWQRLDWIATSTWRSWFSVDGVSWSSFGQAAQTFVMNPTHYGLGVSTWGTGSSISRVGTFDVFRVYTEKPSYWVEG